jgi:hypothetical protein
MKEPVESSVTGLGVDVENREADPKHVEPLSQAGGSLEKTEFEERLTEMIEKEVSRRFQSAKDKRWVQLEKQYGDLSELRGMAEALLTLGKESKSQTAQQEVDLEARIRSLADLPGLSENEDARALILRSMTVGDLPSYVQVMEDLIRMTMGESSSVSALPPVSAATAVIPGGSGAPGDLAQSYQRRKQKLRPGDVNALTALKREFRQKGLDVF